MTAKQLKRAELNDLKRKAVNKKPAVIAKDLGSLSGMKYSHAKQRMVISH